jgi:hypothetical protein
VAFASGNLPKDSEPLHVVQRLCDGRGGDANFLSGSRNRDDRVPLHMLKDAEHRRCRTTKRLDLFLMFGKERNDPASDTA